MDGKQIEGISVKGKGLFVGKAEKKEERRMKLSKQYENQIMATQGLNVYVKNFDEGYDNDKLKSLFEPFGKITSCIIVKDEKTGASKGFGFVCFEKPEEAGKAISELHNKIIGNKPLYVTLHQRKDIRQKELEQQHVQRVQGGSGRQQGTFTPQFYTQRQNVGQKVKWGGKDGNKGKDGKTQGGKGGKTTGKTTTPGKTSGVKPGKQGEIKLVEGVRNPKTQEKPKTQKQQESTQDSEISSQLANMSPRSQKQTLGDHLYPMVHAAQPQLASKITGMLLEMENTEILLLLESPEALNTKIIEAVNVLKSHEKKKE